MKVYILLSVIAVAFASKQCDENQHYNACGTACPLTCDNYANPPRFCILICKPGCHCDEGYVKTADGRCVKPDQCPAESLPRVCGENERFESCGSACPLTCENYQNPPKACIKRCDIGCHCEKGFVRSSDGRCVRPDQCPQREQECGENEHFESCGTACPLTCENYQNPPKVCVMRCDIGCHCDKGFVRSSDGRCVKPDQCPQREQEVCGENERYTSCGTACPLTCDNHANPPKICPLMCKIGCECEKGYVRSSDLRCVRPEECPARVPVKKTCDEKPDSGMCYAHFPMWYFDSETGKCSKFVFGGCGGNGNRYGTESECLINCAGSAALSACQLEKEVGPCRAMIPRYYFNKESGKCEQFIYGGCKGNWNNFNSEEDCREICIG